MDLQLAGFKFIFIVKGIFIKGVLKILHAAFIVIFIIYVQIMFFEVNAFCICLAGVIQKFKKAVLEIVKQIALIAFLKENIQNVVEADFLIGREGITKEINGFP